MKNIFKKCYLFIFILFVGKVHSQAFTDSNLPIVIINTDYNESIYDSPRIFANMKIIKHSDGSRNYLSDQNSADFLNYDGRINIEIRGSSSQALDKKPYGFTTLMPDNFTNNNTDLLDMPSENDWILNPCNFEPSFMRDHLSYYLSRQMGDYSSRTVYCELIINGDYRGLYLLEEKLKADSNRINVTKITPSDISLPNVSGGYITKADKTTGGDPVAWGMSSYSGWTDFIHQMPKPEDVVWQQDVYIHDQFNRLETAATNGNSSFINGYPSIIDIPSFIDFMLLNELGSNADGYQLSSYFHKDRNGKLRAGPIWDFNLTYGNDLFLWGFDRSHYDVWQFHDGGNDGPKFWTDLFNNSKFNCYLSKRWNELIQPDQPLNKTVIYSFMDATVSTISEALGRENQRWGTVPDYLQEIDYIKNFISNRIYWMSANLGSFTACNSVPTPPLVISKINYNPIGIPSISNELEFIEISNTGSSSVNLTGTYFRELGITYQFPVNSSIAGKQNLFLASNPAAFQSQYGIAAFGQFTRNLSNKSQKLVLADGFGNTIDAVEYLDKAPWPTEADGLGAYLKLKNNSLDNSLAENWEAYTTNRLTLDDFSNNQKTSVYPNPVSNSLNIQSDDTIVSVGISDVLGAVIYSSELNSNTINIDFSLYSKGIYILTIQTKEGTETKKIVKQ